MTSPAPRKTSVPPSRCAIRRVSQIRPAPLRRRKQKWSFPGRSAPVPVRSLATPPGEHTAGDTGACAEKGCGFGQTAELPVVPLKHEKLDPCSSGGRSPGDVPPVPCADKGPVVGSGHRCLVSGHHNGRAGGVWFQDIVPSVCRDIIPGCGGTSFPIATTNKNEAIIYAITEAGMSINEAAQRFSLSARWIRVLLGRYHDGGIAALAPRSRRPHTNPTTTTSEATRARVIALRHELTSAGLDAGAESIYDRLPGPDKPSVSTIWRILKSQGQVRPQPQKRPRSSWRRFQAEVPNETWQSDFTHWLLADGTVPGRFTPARS